MSSTPRPSHLRMAKGGAIRPASRGGNRISEPHLTKLDRFPPTNPAASAVLNACFGTTVALTRMTDLTSLVLDVILSVRHRTGRLEQLRPRSASPRPT